MRGKVDLLNRTGSIRTLFLAMVACCLPVSSVHAATERGITTNVTVSPDSLFIGDRISLVIEVSHPDSVDLSVEGLAADLDSFEVTGRDSLVTTGSEGRIVHRAGMSLTTFETGDLTAGPFRVFCLLDGRPDTLEIEGPTVRVHSLLEPGSSDIRDIKGLAPVPGARWPWVAGLVVLIAGLTGYLVWRRRRIRAPGQLEVPDIALPPPDRWARERLDEIERMELLPRQRVKEHYIRVTGVLRKFLGMRFGIETLERTTEEMLSDLERAGVPDRERRVLRELLEEGDLVKFARWTPAGSVSASYIDRTREAVGIVSREERREEVPDAVC